ncbi:MAG TPA: endonuclease/exonuclease/phosphatase family protein, partial [Longimicrobium sp.]|nr:endonuclease/exonuclease/phosphatase family protein [Longimicrobium sp.]
MGHLAAIAGLMLAFRLAGDRWAWLAVLFYAPRIVYALPAALIAPALLLCGARRWLWAPALAVALVLGPMMGLRFSLPRSAPGPAVRLLSCNVWFGAGELEVLRDELVSARPDIVVFQAAAHAADVLLKEPPFEKFNYLHDDQYVLASRWPARVTGRGTFVSERLHRPWVRFEVDSPLGTLDVIAVHPHSPRRLFARGTLRELVRAGPAGDPGGTLAFLRQQLTEIAGAARTSGPLLVLAGDFNVPDGGSLMADLFGDWTDS